MKKEREILAARTGWQLLYDTESGETWLAVYNARAQGVSAHDGAPYTTLEVVLPEELAELIDVAWRNRPKPRSQADLRAAVLSIFEQSRWGNYTAEGVHRIAHGVGDTFVTVLPHIGAATPQDILVVCEGLVTEGLLLEHRANRHVSFELNRKRFPVE
jgi:hypothetical protein